MATGSLGELVATLTLNTAQFTAGLTKAEQASVEATAAIKKGFESLSGSMDALAASMNKTAKETENTSSSLAQMGSAFKTAANAVQELMAVQIAEKLIDFAKGVADSVNELRILSQQAGVTVEQFLELKTVFEESGVGGELAARMISKMNEALALSADSTSKQAYYFKMLGVTATDASSATIELLTSVGKLHSEQDKIAVLTDIYGARQAREMLPVLDDIIEKMSHAQKVIEDTGAKPSDDLIAKSKEYKTAITDAALAWEGLTNALGKYLVPVMTTLVNTSADFFKHIKDALSMSDDVQKMNIALSTTQRTRGGAITTLGVDAPTGGVQGGLQPWFTKTKTTKPPSEVEVFAAHEKAIAAAKAEAIAYEGELDKLNKVIDNSTDSTTSWFDATTNQTATEQFLNKKILEGAPIKKADADFLKLMAYWADEAAMAHKAYADSIKDWNSQADKELAAGEKLINIMDEATKQTTAFTASMQDQINASNLATNAMGLSATEQKVVQENNKIDIDLRKQLAKLDEDAIKITNDKSIVNKQAALDEIAADKQTAEANAAAAKQIIDANTRAQDSFSYGWQKAFQSYTDGLSAAKLAQDAFNSLTSSLETLFQNIMSGSKTAWATFKASAISAIESVVSKIAVSGLLSMFSGGASGAGLLGGLGTALTGGGLGSAGGAIQSGEAGALGDLTPATGLLGSLSTIGTSFTSLGTVVTEGVGALGGFSAALTATLPALGAIGVAGLAAYALYQAFSKPGGGPKSGGSASTTGGPWANFDVAGGTRGYTPSDADTALLSAVTANQQSYNTILAALGGKGTAQFNLAYDTDPSGTAGTRIKAGAMVDGKQVYGDVNRQFGKDSGDALTADLSLEAQRTLLAALQASDLPTQIANLLNSLTASTATSDQITQMLAVVQTVTTMNTALSTLADPMKAATDSLAKANETALGAWDDQRTALYDLANAAPDTAAGLTDVTNATVAFAQSTVALLQAMQTAKKGMDDMFAATSDSIAKAGLTNEQLYSLDQSKAQGLYGQLAVATDPAVIADLSKQINDVITEAFGLLSPDDQLTQKQAFLDGIALVNKTADDAMTKAMGDVTTQAQTDQAFMNAKLTEILAGITAAGKDFKDGSDQLAGGVNVNVTVSNTPQSDVNG